MAKTAKPNSSFRDELAELETITQKLEDDAIDLDEALDAFERGSQLVGKIKQQLDAAEIRITKIQNSALGGEKSQESLIED